MATAPPPTGTPTPPAGVAETPPPPAAANPAPTTSSLTATERGWDGWPTPPTPEYLIPGMGKVPVSSTVHFQTVVMTSMGDELSAGQLRELRTKLLATAQVRPERHWALDTAGQVTVTTVPVPEAVSVELDAAQIQQMVKEFQEHTPQFADWTHRWLQDAPAADGRAYEEALKNVQEKEQAAARDTSAPAQTALLSAQTKLIVLMGSRRGGFEKTKAAVTRTAEVGALLPALFHPPVSSFAELVVRLDEAGITGSDIDAGYGAEFTAQDALNQLFDIFDDGPLDPFLNAQADAMENPAEGVLLHQEQGWFARGLALGNLLHSVALAPGEVTQIAMTHWNHSTRASDSETVSQQDSTAESDTQDRAVSEIQQAAALEHTSGSSAGMSFGTAAQAGYAGFGISASGGMSSNVSTVVSTSDGSKDLSMEANQHVAAVTQRHAEAARTRRATVVREVSQSEAQDLTTRVLANYNHMHALTVMYFEVIEAFDLKTRVVDAERLIFLPFKVREVQELIPRFRAVLIDAAHAARKPALALAFQHYQRPPDKQSPLDNLDELAARIKALDGPTQDETKAGDTSVGEIASVEAKLTAIGAEITVLPNTFVKLRTDIESAIDTLSTQRAATMAVFKDAPAFLGSVAAQALQLQWQALDNQVRQLRNQSDALTVAESRALSQLKADKAATERQLNSLRAQARRLKDARQILLNLAKPGHTGPLQDNQLYFNQAVWLSLSPGEVLGLARRRYMFRGEVLCERIDPAPVAITGNYVAYRWRFDDAVKSHQFKQRHVEPFIGDPDQELATVKTTIAVPTGGVFGEAVLGQAVSAEKIDLSRFWNWKDSMIPILPTSINPLTAASPTMQNLSAEPGKLDESSAKLGQLQDLPMPAGFQALAETMRAQMFRDMSGQTMLQSLAEATTKAAASGSSEAAQHASENYRAGLDFAQKMAPMVLEAMAAPETGGASLMAGKLNAPEGGGTSLLGGMLNAKDSGSAGDLLGKLAGGLGKGKTVPADPHIPPGQLEEFDATATKKP